MGRKPRFFAGVTALLLGLRKPWRVRLTSWSGLGLLGPMLPVSSDPYAATVFMASLGDVFSCTNLSSFLKSFPLFPNSRLFITSLQTPHCHQPEIHARCTATAPDGQLCSSTVTPHGLNTLPSMTLRIFHD